MTLWNEVENVFEEILNDYERVNHLISLYQDEKIRIKGLKEVGSLTGVGLELGSGPGNFSRMITRILEGPLVCLDYSEGMLTSAKNRLNHENLLFIRGIFESIPIRKSSISFTSMAFALRDSKYKSTVLKEIRYILENSGKLLIIDIGKPNNRVIQGIFTLYMRYAVPLISGLFTDYGYRNPWRLLYKTYTFLPKNKYLLDLVKRIMGEAELKELVFGCYVILTAHCKPITGKQIVNGN